MISATWGQAIAQTRQQQQVQGNHLVAPMTTKHCSRLWLMVSRQLQLQASAAAGFYTHTHCQGC